MEFDVDVSGEDLLSKNYTVCIANKNSIIRGFKFSVILINSINQNYNDNKYRYKISKKGKTQLKIRLYCVVLYYLFQDLEVPKKFKLNLCRDFDGRENDIKSNLEYFLKDQLGISFNIQFGKLSKDSNAHRYAYLMRKDFKNKMDTYIDLDLKDLEKFLKK